MYLVRAARLAFGVFLAVLLLYGVYLYGEKQPETFDLPGWQCQRTAKNNLLCKSVETSPEEDNIQDHQRSGMNKKGEHVSLDKKEGRKVEREKSGKDSKYHKQNESDQRKETLRKTVLVPSLSQTTINGVEKFVFFIGYARSSHSIVGSMMDAHPNVMLAHEYMLFSKWAEDKDLATKLQNKTFLFNELYKVSHRAATYGLRSGSKDGKGYSLDVREAMWQGKYTELKVIGDKSGGKTARLYSRSPDEMTRIYHELARTVKVPIRVVHVVRNPYDMIASRVLFSQHDENGQSLHDLYVAGKLGKVNLPDAVNRTTISLFKNVQAVTDMIPALNLTTLEIHNADFVKNPKGTLKKVCKFLDLKCPMDYLQACSDKTYKAVSRTRNAIVWDHGSTTAVKSMMKHYPFLERYSFQSD